MKLSDLRPLKRSEPKVTNRLQLCPNCPFRSCWDAARQSLLSKQMSKVKEEPSALKICMELRVIARKHDLECPYYQNESLTQEKKPKKRYSLGGFISAV